MFIVVLFFGCKEDQIVPVALGDLVGQVVLKENNQPVEGAEVTTNPPTSSLLTDAFGNFSLIDIPSGTYNVRIEKDNLSTRLESVSVIANQTTDATFALEPDSINNSAPNRPILLFPEDGQEISISEEFRWFASDPDQDELTYDLLIFNADQSETIELTTNSEDSSFIVDELNFGRSYFWQVIASDGSLTTFSEVLPFQIQDIPDFRFSFVKEVENRLQVFTGNPDEEEYQLTDCPKNAWRPRLSPLRDRMAFLANVGIETHLFTVDRNGNDMQQVTSLPVTGFDNNELDFSWSPDGAQFIYMNQNRLYKINRDGTGLTEIAQAAIGWTFVECDWSAQTQNIVVRIVGTQPHNSQIYTIDQMGNFINLVQGDVPGSTTGGAFSIAGDEVVFSQDVSGFQNPDGRQLDAQIFIRNVNTQELIDLSEEKPAGTNDLDPRYSPDGAFIIFTNSNNDGISPKSIYKMNLDGTDRELLFENAQMPDWE